MQVRSADNLRVYRDPEASVVVLEYEVHGESVQTGRPYDNRFVSIITVQGRESGALARLPRPDRRLRGDRVAHRFRLSGHNDITGRASAARFGRLSSILPLPS